MSLALWMAGIVAVVFVALLVASPNAIKGYCCKGFLLAEWLEFLAKERVARKARWAEVSARREAELRRSLGLSVDVQHEIPSGLERGA